VRAAVVEADDVRQKRRAAHASGDRTWFKRMHELQTMEHAREVVVKVSERPDPHAGVGAQVH
jgi:hypothetical protein